MFVDVGANTGQTALRMAESFPAARIYSFEPVRATFDKLRAITAHVAGVECVNAALGATPGEAMMTTDRNRKNTLVPEVTAGSRANVRVDTVDNFCAERGIDHIDLLKIDTEGYEASVLEGASHLLQQGRVDFVMAECDFVRRPQEPHGDFFELHRKLDSKGFRVVSFYTGVGRCADDARRRRRLDPQQLGGFPAVVGALPGHPVRPGYPVGIRPRHFQYGWPQQPRRRLIALPVR